MPAQGGGCKSCCHKAMPCMGLSCGVGSIAVAIALAVGFDDLLHAIVNSQAVIKPSMKFYYEWEHPGEAADVQMTYYLWNVSNAEEVMSKPGVTPSLEPVGPFVYTMGLNKGNISYGDGGNKVYYTYSDLYFFDSSRSKYDETLSITMPNLGIIGAAYRSMNAGTYNGMAAASECLNVLGTNYNNLNHTMKQQEREFSTRPVREWLWGHKDPLVDTLQTLIEILHLPIKTQEWISLQFNDSKDMWNHTTGMYTGKDDHDQGGELFQWEGCYKIGTPTGGLPEDDPANLAACAQRQGDGLNVVNPDLNFWGVDCSGMVEGNCTKLGCAWNDNSCTEDQAAIDTSIVRGTDGFQQPPNVKTDDDKWVFIDQMFRSFKLTYTADAHYNGISATRWSIAPDMWESDRQDPANAGWADNSTGLLNITRPQALPVFLSKPSLASAPEAAKLINQSSLPASVTDDQWFLYEPWTGLALAADVNVQINLRMEDLSKAWNASNPCPGQTPPDCWNVPPTTTDGHPFTAGLKTAYYPLVTIRQSASATTETTDKLKNKALNLVNGALTFKDWAWPFLLGIGIIVSLACARWMYMRRKVARQWLLEH